MVRAERPPAGGTHSELNGCARRIDDAAAKADWAALALIDVELRELAARVATGERLTPAQRAELRVVADAFERALRQVGEAHGTLGRKMAELNEGRHAWLAYASISEDTSWAQ